MITSSNKWSCSFRKNKCFLRTFISFFLKSYKFLFKNQQKHRVEEQHFRHLHKGSHVSAHASEKLSKHLSSHLINSHSNVYKNSKINNSTQKVELTLPFAQTQQKEINNKWREYHFRGLNRTSLYHLIMYHFKTPIHLKRLSWQKKLNLI